jgi:hypothetical protein
MKATRNVEAGLLYNPTCNGMEGFFKSRHLLVLAVFWLLLLFSYMLNTPEFHV